MDTPADRIALKMLNLWEWLLQMNGMHISAASKMDKHWTTKATQWTLAKTTPEQPAYIIYTSGVSQKGLWLPKEIFVTFYA